MVADKPQTETEEKLKPSIVDEPVEIIEEPTIPPNETKDPGNIHIYNSWIARGEHFALFWGGENREVSVLTQFAIFLNQIVYKKWS